MYYTTFSFGASLYYDGIDTYDRYSKIIIYCKRKYLDESGKVVDIKVTTENIREQIDKKDLSMILGKNITPENLAKYIYNQIVTCYRVKIIDNFNNEFVYKEDENE